MLVPFLVGCREATTREAYTARLAKRGPDYGDNEERIKAQRML